MATPPIVRRDTLLAGYLAYGERVLGETEPALVDAHFECSYEEVPVEEFHLA